MTKKRIFLALFSGFAALAPAAVFMKLGRTPLEARAEALGGKKVYESAVEVNGAGGRLQCFGFESRPENLAALGLPSGGSGALATREEGGERITALFVPHGEGGVLTVFRRPKADAAAQWPGALPRIEGITPTFSAVCRENDSVLGIGTVETDEFSALGRAGDALRAAGWRGLPPETGLMRWFYRDGRVCLVFARQADETGKVRLALLTGRG